MNHKALTIAAVLAFSGVVWIGSTNRVLAHSADPATQPSTQPSAQPSTVTKGEVSIVNEAKGTKRVTETGLTIIDVAAPETGEFVAKAGDQVFVHYTGRLADGKEFDSSYKRGEAIDFVIGNGRVIKGWEEGIAGMKLGEKRQLIIPPTLGYGDRNVGNGLIPPNSTLVFDVELMGLYRAKR